MSSDDDLTPFGSIFPTADAPLPPPPAAPSPEATDPGPLDEPSQAGSSPIAVLAPARPHDQLGNDWSFGAKCASTAVSLPRSRKSIALALAVILLAATGAYFFLNRSKSSGGTALALALTQGQTYRYHLDMSFNGSIKLAGQEAPVNAQFGETFSWKVESVDPNGIATVNMTVEELTGTVNGQSSPAQAPLTIEIRVAKDGRILTAGNLAIAGGSTGAQAFPGTDQFLPLLPDHPVKPGDTWTKAFDQDFPFGNGKIHYVSDSSYLRDEIVNGVKAAVITGTVKVPLDLTIDPNEVAKALGVAPDPTTPKGAKVVFTGNMNLTQTAWLDLAKHTLLKGSISGTMDMTMELKGVAAPSQIPDGKIGFSGTVNLQIRQVSGEVTPPPVTSNKDKKAQSELRNALVAAKTYFVDHNSYAGLSPKDLKKIEPSLAYNTSSSAKKGEVSIRDASKASLVLVIRSAAGHTFCLVDDVNGAGVVYGTQDAKKAADCSGGW